MGKASAQVTIYDTIISGGLERDMRIYIPAIYDGSSAVPLLFNLHGYSSDNFGQALYANFNPMADTAGFITVLPNGTLDGSGFRFWNCWGLPGEGVDDVQFISDVIDYMAAHYNIDLNRVYSTGMSNGGFMSHTLACELSDRIAAIASVAGTMSPIRMAFCDPHHTTPVMQIHGTADDVVPFNGNIQFISADSIVHYWVTQDHCNADPAFYAVPDINTGDGCTAEKYTYPNCWKGTEDVFYKVIGGEHTWPGTAITFLGVTNLDFNACLEIWKFLSQYRLDELLPVEQTPVEQTMIYPNPVAHVMHVSAQQIIEHVEVIDMQGRICYNAFPNTAQCTIPLDGLQSGMYVVRLRGETGTEIRQIAKY
ncbi:MAG: T9SS type A sorting domain-containing protein [Chitinophagales bacterium]